MTKRVRDDILNNQIEVTSKDNYLGYNITKNKLEKKFNSKVFPSALLINSTHVYNIDKKRYSAAKCF